MATKDEIKKVILDIAGNPESGIVKQYADVWAEAIAELDAPPVAESKAWEPVKETRVLGVAEKR